MTTDAKSFSLGAVLSVTHDHLVARAGMGDVYAILNHMTGDNLSTIGLLAAHPPCKDSLLAQHPQLRQLNADSVGPENWRAWLDGAVRLFGETLPVAPLASWERRTVVDDVLDVNRLNPDASVIVLDDDPRS